MKTRKILGIAVLSLVALLTIGLTWLAAGSAKAFFIAWGITAVFVGLVFLGVYLIIE